MLGERTSLDRISHFVHDHFLGLLLATYAIAAVLPGLGLAIRDVSLGRVGLAGESMNLSLPSLMLGFLLLNAGLGVKASELRNLARRPSMLGLGLAANLADPDRVHLRHLEGDAGLAQRRRGPAHPGRPGAGGLDADRGVVDRLVAERRRRPGAQPGPGAWARPCSARSPRRWPCTPSGSWPEGDYAEDLHELASHGSGVFLMACVVVPSLLGIAIRLLVGEPRLAVVRPYLKLANSANLLVLSYSNASAALPQAIANPDWDFLGAILAITSSLCVLAFASGGAIARLLKAEPSTRVSLMYGLGMNNNGTGLVLASMALADHPRVMLPIIVYNLVQQVVAGVVGSLERRRAIQSGRRRARDSLGTGPRVALRDGRPDPPANRERPLHHEAGRRADGLDRP